MQQGAMAAEMRHWQPITAPPHPQQASAGTTTAAEIGNNKHWIIFNRHPSALPHSTQRLIRCKTLAATTKPILVAFTSKTATPARPARHLAPITIQMQTKFNAMGGSVSGVHKTIMPSQYGCQPNRRMQREPSQNYLQWHTLGFLPRPNNGRRGEGRQKGNLMAMPHVMGQPPMMRMAGIMPVSFQQPMANSGFGNNTSFYRANMGYGQGNGAGNKFWQLAGQVLGKAPQHIRNYFTNYSKCLTPTTVSIITRAIKATNSQKSGDALHRARDFIPCGHVNKSYALKKFSTERRFFFQQRAKQSKYNKKHTELGLNNMPMNATCEEKHTRTESRLWSRGKVAWLCEPIQDKVFQNAQLRSKSVTRNYSYKHRKCETLGNSRFRCNRQLFNDGRAHFFNYSYK